MTRAKINRTIRTLLGLSGKELADRVEVTKQTISNYECERFTTYRPLERVIEIELDLELEKCNDEHIKNLCETLKLERTSPQ